MLLYVQIRDLQLVFDMMEDYLATQQAARVTPTVPSSEEESAGQDGQDGQNPGQNEERLQRLFDLTERAHKTLRDLVELKEKVSGTAISDKRGKQSVSRLAWVFRDKKKAAELCQKVRQDKQNLFTAISILIYAQL